MVETNGLSPAQEAQQEDEKQLAQNKQDIEEVLKLIAEQTDRKEAEKRLMEAETRVEEGHQGRVFHAHQARKIPLHGHTSHLLHLAEALELSMRTKRHGEDLHRSLGNLSRHRVKLLRRIMERGLF